MSGMASDHATVAEEEYLQSMYWLFEAGLPITGANIARAMQLSAPTVHEMVGRLEQDGYVRRAEDRSIAFTEQGRDEAETIVRRHRMIERFLTDVLGIPWDEVHEEAERLEHAMSPVLEERMRAAIGDATTCPHGHPIVEGAREEGALLADVEPGAGVHVLRFENEAEDLLHYLMESGLHPGLEGTLESSDDNAVVIASEEGRHEISRSVAETVSVRADPAPEPRAPLPEALELSSDRYGR
jgi:DtxR family transcriptional regulator, Mn-dependent transcriptional regulator